MEEFRSLVAEVAAAFGRLAWAERSGALALLREMVSGVEREFRSHLLSDALPTLTAAFGHAEIQSSSWLSAVSSPGFLDPSNADFLTNVIYETLRTEEPAHTEESVLKLQEEPPQLQLTQECAASASTSQMPQDDNSHVDIETSVIAVDCPENTRRWHSCPHCPKRFVLRRRLFWHLKEHRPPGYLFACALCGEFLRNRSAYTRHFGRTHGRLPASVSQHSCFCGFSSKHRQSLHRHRRRAHSTSSEALPCPLCPARLATKSALREHCSYRHGEKAVPCPHCPKTFVLPKDRNKHVRFCHTNTRRFPCQFCAQSYKTAQHLRRHVSAVHHNAP